MRWTAEHFRHHTKKMKLGDQVKITTEVEFIQAGKVIARGHNTFVQQGLRALAEFFFAVGDIKAAAFQWTIMLGQDTTTPTTYTTTDPINPIAIGPSSKTHNFYTDATGYRVLYQATWNAGLIAVQVGEAGLYLYSDDPASMLMFSRLSVADGDFFAFTPDPTLPLTVKWTLKFAFS